MLGTTTHAHHIYVVDATVKRKRSGAVPPKSHAHAALGAAIRQRRAARNLSQEDLAHLSGVHRSYLGAIERGEINLSYSKILQVSQSLGLRPSELLALAENDD